MRHNFLGRVGRAVQVFGLVVVSVFYSVQSEAHLVSLQTGVVGEITISKDSDDTISYYFSTNIIAEHGWKPEFRVSFSDTPINSVAPPSPPPESLVINTLTNNSSTDSSLVTETEITSPHTANSFYLGAWSDYLSFSSVPSPHLATFIVKFSRDQLWEWVSKSGKNTLDFYVVVHARAGYGGYYYHWTSSLKVEIPIKRVEYAHIDGLKDVSLPQADDMHFCVLSTTGRVELKFEAINSTTAFQLQASDSETNPYPIDYDISLTGKIGGGEQTVPVTTPGIVTGKRWDANLTKPSDTALCTGIENMSLLINFKDQQQADDAPPGEYKDTITITVSPT